MQGKLSLYPEASHDQLHQVAPGHALQRSQSVAVVGNYNVNAFDVKGKGAYGIVYAAIDRCGNKIAAKRIDGKSEEKLKKVTVDLGKLRQLRHRNIVNIFDVCQEETTIWIFMEFCESGDLNMFFQDNVVTSKQMLSFMFDIAYGVQYLHDKNIIHRDIKPANVLISGDRSIAKLTDFDVSKFLEEEYDTSLMTTSVGTRAFKAPEFFKRNSDGKPNYHRNVDIYAMGLTFLAMIQGRSPLIARIETPQEPSDLREDIGVLIAERIKYKIQPLTVIPEDNETDEANPFDINAAHENNNARKLSDVVSEARDPGSQPGSEKQKLRASLKKLIQQMTCVDPEDRLSAGAVVAFLAEQLGLVLQAERLVEPEPIKLALVSSSLAASALLTLVPPPNAHQFTRGRFLWADV